MSTDCYINGEWDHYQLQMKGFRRGSILRIHMKNFLTNDDCEVFPGPKLNIVIGPNGTGKSTLTHAICLACCGSTGDVGRSNDLSKFVKHGKEGQECFVEVDIMMLKGTLRIRRILNSDNRGSKWTVNGRPSTQTDIKKQVIGLSIDVDNLCSFMPQDKVGNFTRFNPKEMMENTMKAIRMDEHESRTMHDEQRDLADIESVKIDHRRELQIKQAKLDNLKVELRGLEVERDRMKQRNLDKELLEVYELKKLLLEVKKCSAELAEKQQLVDAAEAAVHEEKALIGPLEAEEREVRKSQATRVRALDIAAAKWNAAEAKLKQCGTIVVDTEELLENKSLALVRQLESRHKIEQQLAREQEQETALAKELVLIEKEQPKIAQQLINVGQETNALTESMSSTEEEVRELTARDAEMQTSIQQLERQMNNLQDPRQVYRMKLESILQKGRRDKGITDCLTAMAWIDANQDKLKGVVHGPVAMLCEVADAAVAMAVEKAAGTAKMLAFLVEDAADGRLLSEEFRRRKMWVDVYTMSHRDCPSLPLTSSALRTEFASFNMQGYLIDFVKCPDIVKAYLSNFVYLHSMPFTKMDSAQVPDELLNRLSNYFKTIRLYNHEPSRARFGQESVTEYNSKRSKYAGANTPLSSSSSQVMNWLRLMPEGARRSGSAGPAQEESVQEARQRLQLDIDRRRQQQMAIKQDINRIRELNSQQQIKLVAVRAERNRLVKLQKEPAELRTKIAKQQASIQKLQQRRSGDFELERTQKQQEYQQQMDLLLDRIQFAVDASNSCLKLHTQRQVAFQATTALNEQLAELKSALQQRNLAVKELERKVKAAQAQRNAVESRMELVHQRLSLFEDSHGDRAVLLAMVARADALPESTGAEVEAKMQEIQQRISGSVDNQRALERYEEVKESTERLDEEVTMAEAQLEQEELRVQQRAQKWLDDIDSIASKLDVKFSVYMSELNYEGNVQLIKAGTFDTYELQILVSFRKSSKPVPLSGTSHSGGERAVATVMYLMALQDSASSPFRVVDEINQGMDQSNERMVFDRIVHNCCEREDKPQYFLVTPKLLHGLRAMDDDQVTVLLVFNGPGISDKWQLTPILHNLKAQRSTQEPVTIGQEGDEDGEEEVSIAGARRRAKEASNNKRAATESSNSNNKRSKFLTHGNIWPRKFDPDCGLWASFP
eukprot:gene26564-35232_t